MASCQDKRNIVVVGQITDDKTGQPIAKAEVLILCWFKNTATENSYEKQTILTDEKGNFKVSFKKGHRIDVASKAIGFAPVRKVTDLKENRIQVYLSLSKINDNPSVITFLRTNYSREDIPFLRIRIHYEPNSSVLDLNSIETFGFDFASLNSTNDTSKCDLWFKPILKDGRP